MWARAGMYACNEAHHSPPPHDEKTLSSTYLGACTRLRALNSGRSKGTAHVVFERASDALEAFKKYNQVALDGKKLNIELVETMLPPGTLTPLSSGIKCAGAWRGGGLCGFGAGGGEPPARGSTDQDRVPRMASAALAA